MLAYTAIAATATAAYFGAPIWTFLIGAGVLMLMAAHEHRQFATSYSKPYARTIMVWAAWQSAWPRNDGERRSLLARLPHTCCSF